MNILRAVKNVCSCSNWELDCQESNSSINFHKNVFSSYILFGARSKRAVTWLVSQRIQFIKFEKPWLFRSKYSVKSPRHWGHGDKFLEVWSRTAYQSRRCEIPKGLTSQRTKLVITSCECQEIGESSQKKLGSLTPARDSVSPVVVHNTKLLCLESPTWVWRGIEPRFREVSSLSRLCLE